MLHRKPHRLRLVDPMEWPHPATRGFVNRRFRVRFPGAAQTFFGLFFAIFELIDRVTTYANRRGRTADTLPLCGLTPDEARAFLRGDQ